MSTLTLDLDPDVIRMGAQFADPTKLDEDDTELHEKRKTTFAYLNDLAEKLGAFAVLNDATGPLRVRGPATDDPPAADAAAPRTTPRRTMLRTIVAWFKVTTAIVMFFLLAMVIIALATGCDTDGDISPGL